MPIDFTGIDNPKDKPSGIDMTGVSGIDMTGVEEVSFDGVTRDTPLDQFRRMNPYYTLAEKLPIVGNIIKSGMESVEYGATRGLSHMFGTLAGVSSRALADTEKEQADELASFKEQGIDTDPLIQSYMQRGDTGKKILRAFSNFGTKMQQEASATMEAEVKPTTLANKFVAGATEAGVNIAEIVGLSTITKSPTVAMATLGAADSYAAGEGNLGVAKGAAYGGLLGLVFAGTGYLPKIWAVATNGLIFGGMKAQQLSTERGGVENLSDEDRQDILVDTLVGSFLALPGKHPTVAEFKANIAKTRDRYIKQGFSEEQVLAAEQKVTEILASPEAALNLEVALNKINEEIATAGLTPKPKEPRQLTLGLGKLEKTQEPVKLQASKATKAEEAKQAEQQALKEKRDLELQISIDFPETAPATTVPVESRLSINAEHRARTQAIIDRAKGLNKQVDTEMRAVAAVQAAKEVEVERPRRTPEEIAAIEALPAPIEEPIAQERTIPIIEQELAASTDKYIKYKDELAKTLDEQGNIKEDFERDFQLYKKGISLEESKQWSLQEELRQARDDDAVKLGFNSYKEFEKELEYFEVPEEARAVIEGKLDPTSGEFRVVQEDVVKSAISTDNAKQSFQDIRKEGQAAYRFIASNEIITGAKHADLTGELLRTDNAHDSSMGVEKGWVDTKSGDYISETALKGGPIDHVYITDKLTNKTFVATISKILGNQKGGAKIFSEGPDWSQVPENLRTKLSQLRDASVSIRKEAKKVNMSIDEYMKSKGMSESTIDLFHKIALFDVRTAEVVPKATKWQKIEVHQIATDLGLDHREVAATLGIDRAKSMTHYTYEEAAKLRSALRYMKDTKEGTPIDIDEIRQKITTDETLTYNDLLKSDRTAWEKIKAGGWKTFRELLSGDMVLGREEPGKKLYTAADRNDMLKRRHAALVLFGEELGLSKVDKRAETDKQFALDVALAQEGKLRVDLQSADVKEAVTKLRAFYKHAMDFTVDRYVPNLDRQKLIREIAKHPVVRYRPNENGEKMAAILASYKERYSLSKKEMEALELLRSEIAYYMPHVGYDKGFLLEVSKDKLRYEINAKTPNRTKIRELEETIAKLEGGSITNFNWLPREVKLAYFEKRHGAQGYKMDAGIAFRSYLNGWLRKMYDEPFLQEANELYRQVSPELKPYAKGYIIDYMGWGKRESLGDVANFIKQFEWARTLGFVGRSAVSNATGILNTLAESTQHPMAAYEGLKKAMTKKGHDEFKQSGLPSEIPMVQFSGEEGLFLKPTEKVRYYAGWLFNKVEFGLRSHAYQTGLELAKYKGLEGEDAYWSAVDTVHKTQFRYGRVGMPNAMRGWLGVFTQFSSYTVKQAELLYKWTREGEAGWAKLGVYMALAAGTKYGLQSMDIDISNAVGIGVRFGDVMTAMSKMSQGEWEEATKHWQMAWAGGNGILPSIPILSGPTLQLIEDIRSREPDKWWRVASDLEPNIAFKLRDLYFGIKYADNGRYPVFAYDSPELTTGTPIRKKYELNLKDMILRSTFFKTMNETNLQESGLNRQLTKKEIETILTGFDRAIMRGDSAEIMRLIEHYPGVIAGRKAADVKNDFMNMFLTDEQRDLLMRTKGKRYGRQMQYLEEGR